MSIRLSLLVPAAPSCVLLCPATVIPYRVLQARTHLQGSCTALLALLGPSGNLDLAVVGDCGLRVIRRNDVIFASDIQEHAFDTPFQLADLDRYPSADCAASALRYNIALQRGDVIVAGSDGLFDNVWDHQLLELVQGGLRWVQHIRGGG
jgi:protein phosphatase PTC7